MTASAARRHLGALSEYVGQTGTGCIATMVSGGLALDDRPQMSVGASDSIYFRALGLPSYGIPGVFIDPDDDFPHGLNERAPLASVDPGLLLTRTVIVELSK